MFSQFSNLRFRVRELTFALARLEQRLAAEHALKVEQLKVQQTLVVSQMQIYYAQMHAQQQQYAAAMQAAAGAQANPSSSKTLAQQSYAPYSPTSPPAAVETSPYMKSSTSTHLHPCPPVVPQHPAYGLSPRSSASPPPASESLKRSRACSTVSSHSTSSTSMSSASAYTHQTHPIQQAQVAVEPATKKPRRSSGKPSHDDVMAALRLKCERNQAVNGWASQQRQQVAAPPVAQAPVANKKRSIAPRTSPADTASSMQPPVGRPVSRSPPLRYTAAVARAPEPVKAEPVEIAAAPTPSHNVGHSSSFRMLLNASEAIAAGAA